LLEVTASTLRYSTFEYLLHRPSGLKKVDGSLHHRSTRAIFLHVLHIQVSKATFQSMSDYSSCTREDTSNYWTASIYFKSPENGTYRKVPQMANGRLNRTLLEQDGGLTIYYMRPFSGTNKNTTAMTPVGLKRSSLALSLLTMPQGFRMLAGNPNNRNKNGTYPGICHRCLQADERITGGSGAPCDAKDTSSFPSTPCPGGIRATIIFPSCWDGVTLDSPDHRSHVAYSPGSSGLGGLAGDKCPSTHPVRIPQVMYEIMFDTSGFADPKYYQNGTQPLVYSFGDP
jgi:hypothetical protein